jgi:Fic family protein
MPWNWELPDWPNLTWDAPALAHFEQSFLLTSGEFLGAFRHLRPDDHDRITTEVLTSEAMTTSEIEGEILDRASVQSSIRRQLGLATDDRRVPPAERGIAEMMVDNYQSFAAPLTAETLCRWHGMLMRARNDVADVGRYRSQVEPMQVVSGDRYSDVPTVHFEAPPSSRVPEEMSHFLGWFNRTGPNGEVPLTALARAGTAHLYFESIHPFEDGNGRIGRAIAEKALAQTIGQVTYVSLAGVMLSRRKAYYRALEAASRSNEVTDWLSWFAEAAIEAQAQTIRLVEFLLRKARLFDRFKGALNARQEKALLRMFREGPEGFKGGLSASNYMSITGAPASTATRDLTHLVEMGALIRKGERRYARYYLSIEEAEAS